MYGAYLDDWQLGTGDTMDVAVANALDAALHDEGLIGIGRDYPFKTVHGLRCSLTVRMVTDVEREQVMP